MTEPTGDTELDAWLAFALAICDEADSLALAFFRVMLGVALRREISAETHRDRTGRNLSKARRHNDLRRINCAGQSRGQREGYG